LAMRQPMFIGRCLALTIVTVAAWTVPARSWAQKPAAATGSASADDAVLSMLQSTIVDADYNRIDLEKIVDELRENHNLNVHVSWSALEAEGIRRDLRIEVRLKHVTLATLLEIVLREAGASSGAKTPPTYHVQDGVLVITTGEGGREDTILRTYD